MLIGAANSIDRLLGLLEETEAFLIQINEFKDELHK